MELYGTSLMTLKSSMEFHVTSGKFLRIPQNSTELLHILLINFKIREVYFVLFFVAQYHRDYTSANPLVVEILRYNAPNTTFCFGGPDFA